MPDHRRHIRSFVRRDSRVTKAQSAALENYLEKYRFRPGQEALSGYSSVNLEIGAGDGQCTLDLSRRRPASAWVAAEVYRAGLGRLVHAVEQEGLVNVRASDEDVVALIATVPPEYFDSIMIFFPDPWPKKRHHKRRLINEDFFVRLSRVLKRNGRVFIATDIEDYALQILEAIDGSSYWTNLSGPGTWSIRPKFRILTKFEAKGVAAGRKIFDVVARKN